MAGATITGSTGNQYIDSKIVWTSTSDVASNTSSVTAKLYYKRNNSGYTTKGTGSFSITINGTKTTASKYVEITENSWTLAMTATVGVTHTADGSKSITISATGSISGTSLTSTSSSGTAKLDTIARASDPTVSATSVQMGKTVTITTNRKSSSFTHTLTYSLNGSTGTIATSVGTSYKWTVPDLAAKITNSTSGKCTITCTTYSGSTKIGSETVQITLKVPDATTPTFSASSVQMGDTVEVSVRNKGASNFTHNVTYSIGGATGTIYTSMKQYCDWTVPKSLANYTSKKTSATCTVTCVTYNGTAKVGTKTATLTLTVPDATVPELSASTVALGDTITISLPREVTAYVHDITMTLKASGSSTVVHSGTVATGKGTSCTWTVPLSYAAKIPAVTKGTITLTVTTRFSDSTTEIGSKTASFTVTVPENDTTKPTLTAELSPAHSLPDPFEGLYIQGKAGVKATITAESTYSTIKTYKLTVEGVTISSSDSEITSEAISTSGSVTVKCTVVDARGYSSVITKTITVIPYANPKVIPYGDNSSVVCKRCLSDGTVNTSGTYLLFEAGRKYSTVTVDGEQRNFCYLRYRYKVSTAEEYGSWLWLIARDDTSIDEISEAKGEGGFDAKTSYTVQVNVYDTAGFSHTITFDIPTAEIDFHLKKNKASFGKYAERVKAVELYDDWDLYLHGNVVADHVIETGLFTHDANTTIVSGSWRYRKWNSGTYDLSGIFEVQPAESNGFSNGVAYYSNQIQIELPFAVETIQYTGTPAEQFYWLMNAALVNGSEGIIGFRLARFTAINTTSPVFVRLVGHGRWK